MALGKDNVNTLSRNKILLCPLVCLIDGPLYNTQRAGRAPSRGQSCRSSHAGIRLAPGPDWALLNMILKGGYRATACRTQQCTASAPYLGSGPGKKNDATTFHKRRANMYHKIPPTRPLPRREAACRLPALHGSTADVRSSPGNPVDPPRL